MPLDGLRAWIGEVERKLGIRTRLFLIVATIALGAAGAGIYLALDTRENAVSEGDVRALQDELEARIGTGSAGNAGASEEVSALKGEVEALQSEVRELRDEAPAPGKQAAKGSGDDEGGAKASPPAGATDGGDAEAAQEALEKALEKAEKEPGK